MQSRLRILPAAAAAAALVHIVILAGLMTLGRIAPREDIPAALPISWIARASAPEPGPAVPGFGRALAPPPLALPELTLPEFTGPALPIVPADDGLSVLSGYVGCGLNQALTAEDRERCEKQRREFYTGVGPGVGPGADPAAADIALAKRFARDKAVQDAPVLLPCFTSAGANLLCLLGGALGGSEFDIGSYADHGRPENPLAKPIRPYTPR